MREVIIAQKSLRMSLSNPRRRATVTEGHNVPEMFRQAI